VHKGGGWLAFVPVDAGEFPFVVRAEKGGLRDTLTVTVSLPNPAGFSFDSLVILPPSLQPSETLSIQAGEVIDLALDGTPGGRAYCIITPGNDTIPMIEDQPRTRPGGRSIFDRTGMDEGEENTSPNERGHYIGSYRVPAGSSGPLGIVYHLGLSPNMPVPSFDRMSSDDSAALSALIKRNPHRAESLLVPVVVVDKRIPSVVELTDSLTTVRTAPGQAYLAIFQPAGVRAEMVGRMGRWLKIKLAETHYGWIPDTAATILPDGTPLGPAAVSSVRTVDGDAYVSILTDISRKVPYRIEERPTENAVAITFYGAVSNTDWIRYDLRDSLVRFMQWSQPQAEVYTLTIHLNESILWGYEARYEAGRFRLDIRKRADGDLTFADLRIVIDPGHAPDPGAIGPTGLAEKDANLAVAMKLKGELEHRGAEVILTRSGAQGLPLSDRPKLAVREKADLFISIHNNALPDGVNPFINNGVSTYFYHPHSEPLARAVQTRLARELGLNDFGLFQANLAVTRPTQYPAILVEGAFMMLPEQEAKLRTDKFQTQLGQAIADGISDFLSGASTSR
ncbi:MAG: N-acetylmuramoyl-L-alanine amidase, partial [candidate division Zixibacteria bacterium]|nr:N-acetylmuramoyl-L-alanine amidase [candidate division Zixibacteria bacterium]